MRVTTSIAELRGWIENARASGLKIGFVPTMGFLHDGHLALVAACRQFATFTVMSIFVNPTQFGPTEDFASYPRDDAGDEAKARAAGVDVLFKPARETMYTSLPQITVNPGPVAERWEGALRPGHFAGVLTIVAKLFNIVTPNFTVFGQKDFQQAQLVSNMIRDLDFPIRMLIYPTQRERDGLAMSSRNTYLDPADRIRARSLSRALLRMRAMFDAGERDVATLENAGKQVITDEQGVVIDYLAVVDSTHLAPVTAAGAGHAVIVAARVGKTRLLDNTVLGMKEPLADLATTAQ